MLSLTRLKSFDGYTFTHSVNVTVLAVALAKEVGFSKEKVEMIGLGGMLHDVEKMKVPDEILNKPGRLHWKSGLRYRNTRRMDMRY